MTTPASSAGERDTAAALTPRLGTRSELFLIRCREGDTVPIPPAAIEKAWARYLTRWSRSGVGLEFPDGGHSFLYFERDPPEYHAMLERPAGSPELWNGLFTLMQETGTAVYFNDASFVTDPTLIPHYQVPGKMSLPEPMIVVRSPQELRVEVWWR